MNRFARVALLAVLTALSASANAGARDFVVLLYCTPWGGCSYQYFYFEDVQVVAEYGRLDVLWSGGWGHRAEGCPECEIENPYPAPAPEPVGGGWAGCGNPPLDLLRYEYASKGIAIPQCSEFTTSSWSSYFPWAELNHPEDNDHLPWGIVTDIVQYNLDTMRQYTYANSITVTSGYRCPVRNFAQGGVATSYHQYGRAVDLYPAVRDDYGEFQLLRYAAMGLSPVEILNWDTYSDRHLHVAW
jgi:hypothetical protein